jgi:hypothetical protein
MNKPELPRRAHCSFDDAALVALHRGINLLRQKDPTATYQEAVREAVKRAYPAPKKLSAKRGRKG